MIDPLDTYHQLMDARPKLLHITPPQMCRWIGRIKQQYGTVAIELRDLQAECEVLKEKAEKWDTQIAKALTYTVMKQKLEAIKDMVSTDLSNHDKLSAIEDILGGGE